MLPQSLPATRSISTGRPLRPRRRQSFRNLAGFQRNLATALDDCPPVDNSAFEALANGPPQENGSRQRALYELQSFEPSSPLIVREASLSMTKQRLNSQGIPGELDEMLSVFDACIEVGKFDRAALVLQRLQGTELLAPEALVELHNCFLHGRIFEIQSKPSLDGAEDVHKWFEKRIRNVSLPHTPETIAFMLKASLLTARGSRLERLVERYMAMLPEETALESLFMTEVLDARDLATLAEIAPAYNMPQGFAPPEVPVDNTSTEEPDLAIKTDSFRVNASPKETPEVLVTPQKGMGLRSLKETLSLFTTVPAGFDIGGLSKSEQREVQARLERDCVESAIVRWREDHSKLMDMGLNTSVSSVSLGPRLAEWQAGLEAHIKEELKLVEAAELSEKKKGEKDLDRCQYGPFLRLSPPDRLSAVTILGTLSLMAMTGGDKGVPLVSAIYHVAKVAEQDIRAQVAAGNSPTRKMTAQKGGARRLMRLAEDRERQQSTEARTGSTIATSETPAHWPMSLKFKVGAALLAGLLKTAKITVTGEHPVTNARVSQAQPAFIHSSQLKKGKKVGVLVPNPALTDLMKREPNCDLLARHLPMVCEPEPWSKFEKGGFLESPVSIVRTKTEERDQVHYAEAAIRRGDMEQVKKGLDVLGKTAWRINRPVLDVMLEAWNKGEAIGDIPALNPDIEIPLEPEASEDPLERRRWMRQIRVLENERSSQHSLRCFINFQLEIARAYRDQTFYFPHNVDFRGRAYPIPAYLNHMGADNVRGLLTFAKGKPLGESGLRWLKIHLANVYGFDKATFKDREQFAVDNFDNIVESVRNPLNGSRWWLQAEDPWQCLAACHEIKAAMESPDPTKFVSHLPIHQDGTCNGLQHYAALGGDVWGAEQVNLVPGDKPADVYSAVADLVREALVVEAAQGNPFGAALKDKILRKVVKQTVMTNVYGVTFVGAKKQVLKQLENLYPTLAHDTGLEFVLCASYIAGHIFKALSTMFSGAHDIQHYLCEIGGRVCDSISPERIDYLAETLADKKKSGGANKKFAARAAAAAEDPKGELHSTIIWTTPLRMPVVQPYRKSASKTIHTCLQSLILHSPDKFDPVDKAKQLQGFPPNFIHSLDASHMLLSALECEAEGLVFASVHDSFWTHAADVDDMGRILRDAFIRIHSEDVIGRLKAEFEARYKGHLCRTRISRKSPVAGAIMEHRKKLRLTPLKELFLEKQRLDLLASRDPQNVKKGEEMVTPGSIFAELASLQDVETDSQATMAEEEAAEAEEAADMEAAEEAQESRDLSLGHPLRGANVLAMHLQKETRKIPGARTRKQMIEVWLPLTFPEVPPKGNFDVRVVRDSKYFFN